MSWIIPVELLMEQNLTWQAVVFLTIVYANGLALFLYLVLSVIQKAKSVFKNN